MTIGKESEDVLGVTFPKDLLFIDLESTGLLSNPDARVIQIAGILLDKHSLDEVDSFQSKVWISKAYWQRATPTALKIHKIPFEELEDQDTWAIVWPKFIKHFKKYKYDVYGQNIYGFDIPMIKRMNQAYHSTYTWSRDKDSGTREIDLWPFFFCSGLLLDHQYARGYASLRGMAKHFHIDIGKKHDALEDCRVTAEILRRVGEIVKMG